MEERYPIIVLEAHLKGIVELRLKTLVTGDELILDIAVRFMINVPTRPANLASSNS